MLIDRAIIAERPLPSPYALHAARMLDRGYVVLPCRPASKVPGTHHVTPTGRAYWINRMRWQSDFKDRMPTEDEVAEWSEWPDLPGLNALTGRVGGNALGLAVFDIDTDPEKQADAAAIHDAILGVLPPTHVGKIGAKGESLFYHVPEGLTLPSRPFNIRGLRVLDILFDGRQTVLPPTVHPDTGLPYRWSRDLTLETTSLDELPPIDDSVIPHIEEALAKLGWQPSHNPVARVAGARLDTGATTPHRGLNDHALANLDAWVPKLGLYNPKRTNRGYEAVPYWRPNAKGLTLDQRQRSLSIHALGIRDMSADEGMTPIDLAMKALSCDLDTAFTFLARSTGWAGDVPDILIDLDALTKPLVIREETPLPAVLPPIPDDDLTYVPGLIGEIVDWIVAAAESPTRELALGTAMVVVGTLIGRRYAGPTMSGTHLYCAMIGPTSSGKEWPQEAAGRLLTAAGAAHHIGPDEYMSVSGAINAMASNPLHASIIDELGSFIRKINNKKGSNHEQAISKFVRSVFNKSFGQYRSPEWVGKKKVVVNAPAVSILGGSTVEELMESFAEQDVANGLLNRFWFLRLWEYPEDAKPTASKDVPTRLAQKLSDLYESHGFQATVLLNDALTVPVPVVVPFEDEQAERVYLDFKHACRELQRKDAEASAFVGRTAEIAVRMATIRAVSLDPLNPSISFEDMEWGKAVAHKSALTMQRGAMAMLGMTDNQRIADKIMEFVRSRPGGVSHRELHRRLGQKWPSRIFGDIVKGLSQDAELLKIEKSASPDGTRVQLWYRAEVN